MRLFKTSDKLAIIELVRLNTPKYFDHSELNDLENYLDNEIEEYFVVEKNGEILGSGGINYFLEDHSACISWDVVSPKAQGRGIGRELTQFRIKKAFSKEQVEKLVVRTSQHTFKFYEKQGFNLDAVKKDFWAVGYDLYEMSMNKP